MSNKEKMCEMKNCGPCPMGWFGKKIFGVSIGVWLLAFAVLPQSARGVAWSVRSVGGLWEDGAKIAQPTERRQRRSEDG